MNTFLSTFTRGEKIFELSNHLGNVLETVNDKKIAFDDDADDVIDYYEADVVSANDYYPFGMIMPGRSYSSDSYRYGFNGQERSTELNDNSFTAEFWQYDARLGRRWNVDPVLKVYESPYATFANNPIWNIDPNGADTIPASLKTKQYITFTPSFGGNLVLPTTVSHSHKDAIDKIFNASGGSELFSKNENTIDYMNSTLQDVKPGSILFDANSTNERLTNQSKAYYSASESGSQQAWVNLLLGGMIKGSIPENIVFSENGTVSNYLLGSPQLDQLITKWYLAGAVTNAAFAEDITWGVADVGKDLLTNGSLLTVPGFIGSAKGTIIANPNENTIKITISNVTSVASGDIYKDLPFPLATWHNEEPPYIRRDSNNNSVQPYSNFSQTYNLKLDYKKAIQEQFLKRIKF